MAYNLILKNTFLFYELVIPIFARNIKNKTKYVLTFCLSFFNLDLSFFLKGGYFKKSFVYKVGEVGNFDLFWPLILPFS